MPSHTVALTKLLYKAYIRYQHLPCRDALRSTELSRALWYEAVQFDLFRERRTHDPCRQLIVGPHDRAAKSGRQVSALAILVGS